MLISRADVPTDRLIDYGKERFLKVSADRYLAELDIDPNPPQIGILNAVNNPKYRFITAAVSRRVGKTYIANIIGQIVTLVPGSSVLIMAPNYRLSQISFELQRALIKRFSLEVVKDNAKDSTIELSNGSTIRIGSVNQVDSVVGRSYDLIIFDEAALTNEGENAFNIALRPTLDKPNSKAIFISTPRGKKNWFSTFYQRGFSDDFPQWCSIHATYRDNPRADLQDVEEARNEMSEAEFAQEYEADFTVFEGKIYNLSKESIRNLSLFEASGDVIAGLDVGYKDPTALAVFVYQDGVYYLVDEYLSAEDSTSKHAKALQYYIDKWDIDFIFVDSAAAQFRADLAMDYGISTIDAKKSVLDGISHVSGIIEKGRLIVSSTCRHSLDALDDYRWDARSTVKERPEHGESSHMCDAIRYALYSHQNSVGSF